MPHPTRQEFWPRELELAPLLEQQPRQFATELGIAQSSCAGVHCATSRLAPPPAPQPLV